MWISHVGQILNLLAFRAEGALRAERDGIVRRVVTHRTAVCYNKSHANGK